MKSIIYERLQNYGSFLLVILICFLLLTSCSKTIYKYKNIEYESQEAALTAIENDTAEILNKIETTETSVGGSLMAILPSASYMERNFITMKGPVPSTGAKSKISQFPVASMRIIFQSQIAGIERRGIFSTVVSSESDDPEIELFNEDFAIVLLKKDGDAKWFIRKKNNSEELIPLQEISPALPPLQRTTLWLDSIEKVASDR